MMFANEEKSFCSPLESKTPPWVFVQRAVSPADFLQGLSAAVGDFISVMFAEEKSRRRSAGWSVEKKKEKKKKSRTFSQPHRKHRFTRLKSSFSCFKTFIKEA